MQFLKIEQPKKKLCSDQEIWYYLVNDENFTDDLGGQNREALKNTVKPNSGLGCQVQQHHPPLDGHRYIAGHLRPFPSPSFPSPFNKPLYHETQPPCSVSAFFVLSCLLRQIQHFYII
jgi:hypothetical protein